MRVLVVEDERKVADALRDGLQAERYDVTVEGTAEGAFHRTAAEAFDLILLDRGLPDGDGLDVLVALRQKRINTLVIVVTARELVQDRVAGLEAGADDYIVKPFVFAELLARMRALARRADATTPRTLAVGSLTLDVASRQVTRDGVPIELTSKEFDLIEYFMRSSGQVVSRESLCREVWGEASRTVTFDNVIDAHMARLRRKIDVNGSPSLIRTVRGVGFILECLGFILQCCPDAC